MTLRANVLVLSLFIDFLVNAGAARLTAGLFGASLARSERGAMLSGARLRGAGGATFKTNV